MMALMQDTHQAQKRNQSPLVEVEMFEMRGEHTKLHSWSPSSDMNRGSTVKRTSQSLHTWAALLVSYNPLCLWISFDDDAQKWWQNWSVISLYGWTTSIQHSHFSNTFSGIMAVYCKWLYQHSTPPLGVTHWDWFLWLPLCHIIWNLMDGSPVSAHA